MKLKASFSAVSHFIFLALTQSSKVLKGLYLTSGVLKGINFVLTFCTISWEEIFFLPDLPMVLKEVCSPQFVTKSVSFSVIYGRGLERSQLLPMLLSTPSCTISWGIEMNVLVVLFTADSYPIYMKGLEMSLIFSGYVLLWGLC